MSLFKSQTWLAYSCILLFRFLIVYNEIYQHLVHMQFNDPEDDSYHDMPIIHTTPAGLAFGERLCVICGVHFRYDGVISSAFNRRPTACPRLPQILRISRSSPWPHHFSPATERPLRARSRMPLRIVVPPELQRSKREKRKEKKRKTQRVGPSSATLRRVPS